MTLDRFRRASYSEIGDFVLGGYTAEVGGSGIDKLHDHAQPRRTRLGQRGGAARARREAADDHGGRPRADWSNTPSPIRRIQPLHLRFGIETSYGFDGGNSEMCYLAIFDGATVGLGQAAASENVGGYRLGTQIRGFEVSATLAQAGALWRFPLEPVTMSEGGYERIHQGTVLLHVFPLDLAPGASWQNTIRLKIDDLKPAEIEQPATLTATDANE